MSISFIITTYNIEEYVGECLESLRSCLRSGDQVIVVDDGSTDRTAEIIGEFIDRGSFGPDISWTPVWLNTNTIGGVGIPGNIGLDHAHCDTVFFVDGDDYLIPDEFIAARREYEANPTDICIAEYLEFDQKAKRTKPPADAKKWSKLTAPMEPEAARRAAIDLIAVPWRKFYSTEFLRRHRLRYPEGDFFFEDNPFHWRVCLHAKTIGFTRHVICHHRINRPGQTMASTGGELMAFFTHFRTIQTEIPQTRGDLRRQSVRWLIGNMSWHIPRLQNSAFCSYATRAHSALRQIEESDWQVLAPEMSASMTWHYADRLREGHLWDVIEAWRVNADRAVQTRIEREIRNLSARLRDLETQTKSVREVVQAQQAIEEFTVLKELLVEEEQDPAGRNHYVALVS